MNVYQKKREHIKKEHCFTKKKREYRYENFFDE
jgi:hypothetical protein